MRVSWKFLESACRHLVSENFTKVLFFFISVFQLLYFYQKVYSRNFNKYHTLPQSWAYQGSDLMQTSKFMFLFSLVFPIFPLRACYVLLLAPASFIITFWYRQHVVLVEKLGGIYYEERYEYKLPANNFVLRGYRETLSARTKASDEEKTINETVRNLHRYFWFVYLGIKINDH